MIISGLFFLTQHLFLINSALQKHAFKQTAFTHKHTIHLLVQEEGRGRGMEEAETSESETHAFSDSASSPELLVTGLI